jgi:hypothetical protein
LLVAVVVVHLVELLVEVQAAVAMAEALVLMDQ